MGESPKRATRRDILGIIRDIAYVQWDPITIVAPSHLISIWSRAGDFRPNDLEKMLWKYRSVFLHWTPIASIVLTEDYPIYQSLMNRYPESLAGSWKSHAVRAARFLSSHRALRNRMMIELKRGPLMLNQFKDYVRTRRASDGWTTGSEVSLMLYHLHMLGKVMVVGREGNQNVWGLAEEYFPGWADRGVMGEEEFERTAALRAIRALGTASLREINYYFVRGRYRNLKRTLSLLSKESTVRSIRVEELGNRDERYILEEDLRILESLGGSRWKPRTALIAPFDNLIAGRDRTNMIFGFDYSHEQFLPKERRKFGTYVLPILWGDRLVGRVDLQLDKKRGILAIKSVYAEPGAPEERGVAREISEEIEKLAVFIGARGVEYSSRVPDAWKSSLR